MAISSFRTYLISLIAGGLGALLLMFAVFEFFAMPRQSREWRSYHQVVLDFVPGPRLLIDSGSNSLHAIRPDILERELNIPTFIVSDNAATPLDLRLRRLEKYAQPGDIILLPLEWSYYHQRPTPLDFLAMLSTFWSQYYFILPLHERFTFFVRNISLELLSTNAWRRFRNGAAKRQRESFTNFSMGMLHWSGVSDRSVQNREPHFSIKSQSCQAFLGVGGFNNDYIDTIAGKLADLEKRHKVKVVMAWPAVTGHDCYAQNVDEVANQLAERFKAHGIRFAGKPRESEFGPSHMLDTYYHIDIAAATDRTTRLARSLVDLGLTQKGEKVSSEMLVSLAYSQEAARIFSRGKSDSLRIFEGYFAVAQDDFTRRFMLRDGWSGLEDWGTWSDGKQSKIIFLPHRDKDCLMRLRTIRFEKGEASQIELDGQLVADNSDEPFTVKAGEAPVILTLRHRNPRSPASLGINKDLRLLALGLQAIEIRCP